jgi:hypothetical protein
VGWGLDGVCEGGRVMDQSADGEGDGQVGDNPGCAWWLWWLRMDGWRPLLSMIFVDGGSHRDISLMNTSTSALADDRLIESIASPERKSNLECDCDPNIS